MSVCLIGLGSNQGDRLAALESAVAELSRHPQLKRLALSAWRETQPVGGPSNQLPYLNGAATFETFLGPIALLHVLQETESRLGRQRAVRWGPRTIDLDLLLYDAWTLETPSLVLPHPRMAWRRFVLEPAAEVAGSMIHPTTGWTLAKLLTHLNTTPPYLAITGPIAAGKTSLAQRLAASCHAALIFEQPDWGQLESFYADPPGHAWAVELEFLRHRAALLNTLAAEAETSVWHISDFWFDQSAAFARAWLSQDQLPGYLEQFERLRAEVPRPRLVVLLDAPADRLLNDLRHRGRSCERPLTREQLDRIRQSILEQVGEPDTGPILRLTGDDRETLQTEVLAAMQAME